MKVDRDWWKDFFDKTYLITDKRSVLDETLTRRETDLLINMLRLDKGDNILDLCGGQGRHSLELARRGYTHLTVLDYSKYLIKMGRKMAKDARVDVKFLCADARCAPLKSGEYTTVIIMANSFGYSPLEEDNKKILKESYRMLKAGGRILLDIADRDYVKSHLKPYSWHRADRDTFVFRERRLDKNIIKAREVVVSRKRGLIRDGRYCERLYTREGITRLLKTAGFTDISVKGGVSLHKRRRDYGFLTSRIFAIAAKK